MSYLYVKHTDFDQDARDKNNLPFRFGFFSRYKKPIAAVFFSIGILMLGSAIFPIIQFQLEYSLRFNQMVNPLSTDFYNRSGSILGELTTDYTQINNWFVTTNTAGTTNASFLSNSSPTQYTISVPKLNIKDAVVEIGSNDLKKTLIQYPQTALPGQLGNAVVFGHSVLPQFFNPKSYLTIFSTLYKLKTGDEIDLTFDNVQYRYLVEEMYEVPPTDLSVLEQRFDGRYLTLITCSPPGTYLRRLIVKARIVDY